MRRCRARSLLNALSSSPMWPLRENAVHEGLPYGAGTTLGLPGGCSTTKERLPNSETHLRSEPVEEDPRRTQMTKTEAKDLGLPGSDSSEPQTPGLRTALQVADFEATVGAD